MRGAPRRPSRGWVCAPVLLVLACGDRGQPPIDAEPPSGDPRIARVWSGLVPLNDSAEPQWEERATLAERMRHYAVPGIGVAVIEGHEIAWSEGAGVLKAGEDRAATAETLFHAGSIAKCVSAAAALRLVGEGSLELDEDLNARLTSWRIPDSDLARDERVTLRRLLSHTAGIEDGFTNRSSGDAVPDYFRLAGEGPTVTLEELLDAAPGVDVDGPTRVTAVPGSRYRYANADYAILELLIEDVTGRRFADFMAETVLEPLGMTSSTYRQPLPEALRARAAVEHDRRGRPVAGDRLHIPMLAAGGLWTTPSDLARFLIEILDAHGGASERLLSRELAAEMLTRQAAIPENPLADGVGLGFELGGEGAELYIEHTGGTWGSTAIVWAYPETGQGVVIMTNSASGSLLRMEILLAVALEYRWPLE